jgi:hypothetical protein
MDFITNRIRMIGVAIWVLIFGLINPHKAIQALRDVLNR